MIFRKTICVILALAMLLTVAACASGPKTVVATVNGDNIYLWEVDYLYNKSKDYFEEARGVDLSLNSSHDIKQAFREQLLLELVKDTAVIQKAKAEGFALTDAEKAEVDKEYDDMVQRNIESYMESDFKGEADAEQKARDKWAKSLTDNNLTEEFLRNNMYDNKVHAKFSEHLYADITADDEALKNAYETTIQTEKDKYKADPDAFAEAAANPNNHVIYTPDGWIRVKMANLVLPQELQSQVDALNEEIAALGAEMGAMAEEKGDADGGVVEIYQKMLKLNDQVMVLQQEGKKKLEETAQLMKADLEAGMTFNEIFDKYNNDPQMQEYPYDKFGLLLSPNSNYEEVIKKAALALENTGDTSEVIEMANGYCVIQLAEKLEGGTKPLSDPDVQEFLSTLLLASQRQGALTEYSTNLLSETDYKVYNDRL